MTDHEFRRMMRSDLERMLAKFPATLTELKGMMAGAKTEAKRKACADGIAAFEEAQEAFIEALECLDED